MIPSGIAVKLSMILYLDSSVHGAGRPSPRNVVITGLLHLIPRIDGGFGLALCL